MQPPLSTGRPIEHSLRRDRPLDYGRLSDPILVRRAKDGDDRALAELCERHAPRIEEALAKLCVRLRQFRGESQFATWLHRLVVNTCRDVAQRQQLRRCEPLEQDGRHASDGDPARAAALSELRSNLGACLAEISAEQAKVVVLKDALGFSFEEIAAASGMPVGTAKCYAHRGRNRLRAALEAVERQIA